MAITLRHGLTQLDLCTLNPSLFEQRYPLVGLQSADLMLAHVPRRNGAISPRQGAAREQGSAGARLTVDGIEPFPHPRSISEGAPGLPVQQVFKLIEDHQARLFRSVQDIEERSGLI